MAERRKNGRFAPGSSGNANGRTPKKDSASPVRMDGGWTNWITGHGVMGRDKREGTFFSSQELSFDALAEIWKGDDLAARGVETPVKEALRPGWDLILPENKTGEKDKDGDDESERVADVLAKFKKLGGKQILYQSLCAERGLGGSAILLGANDKSTDLTKPLNLEEVVEFEWMTPLEPREIFPMYGYADPRQPKYGQPEIYRMASRAVLPPFGGQYAETVFDVHESRLLVFPGIRVSRYQAQASQGGWGDSVLVRMWRVLRDFNLAWGSAGVLVSEFARGTYKWKDLLETLSTADGRAGAEARLQFMEWAASTINATVIDADDDYKREAIPLAGLADLLNQFATRLSAAADQPITVLFGTSPAGLNATGESDIRLFYDRISAYQQDKVLPALERIVELCFLTTGDGSIPDNWSIRFRPLWQETAEDRSKAMLTQAQADHTWYQDGVISAEEIAESHWGAGDWNPELKIDFEARKKQQLATHAAVTPEDLHALGKGNGPGPGGAPGTGSLPPGHPATPPPPPPPPGTAAKPGDQTAPTTGGQDMGRSPQDKAKAAAPDPNTKPQPNVANDRRDHGGFSEGGIQPPANPDPWGAKTDDGDDDSDLAEAVAALHRHLQKKIAKKGPVPPPPPGSDHPSPPTTTPGPPAAPDPNTAPQPNWLSNDAGNTPQAKKPEDRTGPPWSSHERPSPAPQGETAPSAVDDPSTERADDFIATQHPRGPGGRFGGGALPTPAQAAQAHEEKRPAALAALPHKAEEPEGGGGIPLGKNASLGASIHAASGGVHEGMLNLTLGAPEPDDEDTEDRADADFDESQHPRDEHGRFGAGSGDVAAKAVESSKANGGLTLDPRTGAQPKKGYSVSVRDGFTVEGKDALKPEHIEKLLKDNADILKSDPKSHVGTWFNPDDNKWYLDISHVEPTVSEGARYGRENKQLGIYDLARGETIKAEEYEAAENGKGRFQGRADATGPSAGSGVRSTHDHARADGRGDEAPRGEGSTVAGNGDVGRPSVASETRRVDWDEDQHPRAADGKFGEGAESSANRPLSAAEKEEVPPPSTHLVTPLNAAEKNAMKQWSGPDYEDINAVARGKMSTFFRSTKETQAIVVQLDSAISHSETTESMSVFRGMHETHLGGLKVGDVVVDKGYVATSMAEHVASSFAAQADASHHSGGAIVEIHVPRGAHALSVGGAHNDEHEVLLPRGSKFKIVAVHAPEGPRKPVRVEADLL